MSGRFLKVLLLCLPGLAQAQSDGLKHDPFARPVQIPPPAAATVASNSAGARAPKAPWRPELRAILAAGRKSIVNVDGVIVPIGEQINGYRLVEVHEETAVFVDRNKKRITLSLRGIQAPPGADEPGARPRDHSPKGEIK